MFIKLTSSTGLNEGKPIYVNMDRIVYFREMENPSQKGSFMVDATNEIIKVKEKPDEIIQLMAYTNWMPLPDIFDNRNRLLNGPTEDPR